MFPLDIAVLIYVYNMLSGFESPRLANGNSNEVAALQ
jgi:hypothetical protein